MNLVFCSDQNYLPHLAAAIHSILAHHAPNDIAFWVVYNDCSEEALQTFRAAVCPARTSLLCDKKLSDQELFVNRHVSKTTYQRLYLDRILPENINRYLYLDCDVLITGTLHELYNTILDECTIAASPEYDSAKLFDPEREVNYFNAGVMLVDRKIWRTRNTSEALAKYVRMNREKLRFWDQDALNGVLADEWKPVSPKWNLTVPYFRNRKLMANHANDEVYADMRIIHFNASIKPWHYRLRHPYKYLYFKYLPEPYLSDFSFSDKNFRTVLRKCIAVVFLSLGLKKY